MRYETAWASDKDTYPNKDETVRYFMEGLKEKEAWYKGQDGKAKI